MVVVAYNVLSSLSYRCDVGFVGGAVRHLRNESPFPRIFVVKIGCVPLLLVLADLTCRRHETERTS